MGKYSLLIAEDDSNLGQILKEYLELKGYTADLTRDGEAAIRAFRNNHYHLCILDIMMPKKDGFTVAREIRETNKAIPFIFLTAKSQQEDTLKGLRLGADDYIKKPFSMEELNLRLQVILRRSENEESMQEKFVFGMFEFDYISHILRYGQEEKILTSKEAELLLLLCRNMNKTLDRSAALKVIWGDDSYFNARSMDVYITKLRKYLSLDKTVKIITVHGQGFRLVIDK